MNKIKQFFSKVNKVSVLNLLALAVVISTVNSTCYWMAYQPEVPEAAKRFKRQ